MSGLLRCLALSALLSSAAAAAQDDAASNEADQDQLDSFAAPPAIMDRDKIVQEEIVALGEHPWAGKYYAGDGLGANIRISVAPTAGVSAIWTGCLGVYGANEGIVEPQPDGSLKLVLNRPNHNGFGGFDEHLLPVRWGARRYLIPPTEMNRFISAINLGDEPRSSPRGSFLLAEGDEAKSIDEMCRTSANCVAR